MITLSVDDALVPNGGRLGARYAVISSVLASLLPDAPDGDVAISYVSEDEIRRLNRMYRKHDAVTDVLSFASGFPEQSHELGDVIISYDQAVRQAASVATDVASHVVGEPEAILECVDLVVHGILHVLGYDHERPEDAAIMFPLQDRIVSECL